MKTDCWQTKPTDRFLLKWIKVHLASRITPRLLPWKWLRPWMITVFSACLGVFAGVVFALGWACLSGCVAAVSQVMDGVDGQFARLTGQQSRAGAFLDSVLDRYADGALMIGLVIYLIQIPVPVPLWMLLVLGSLAVVGGSLVSYTTARAQALNLDTGRPTLASKGTRSSITILTAWMSLLWNGMPIIALVYLALHPNAVVMIRLIRTFHDGRGASGMEGEA